MELVQIAPLDQRLLGPPPPTRKDEVGHHSVRIGYVGRSQMLSCRSARGCERWKRCARSSAPSLMSSGMSEKGRARR